MVGLEVVFGLGLSFVAGTMLARSPVGLYERSALKSQISVMTPLLEDAGKNSDLRL